MNGNLLSMIRFYFAQSVFMTTCHFNASDRINKLKEKRNKQMNCLTSITITLLVLQIIGLRISNNLIIEITSVLALLLTAIRLIFSFINKDDFSHLIFEHKNSAEKYKEIRDEYMSLIEKTMSDSENEQTIRELSDNLRKQYSKIGVYAPRTKTEDYKKSQCDLGLKSNDDENFTWPDEQIDLFLPELLRMKKL